MKLALHGLNWIWLLLSIFENKYFTESSFFTRHLIGFCFIILDIRPQETQSCCIIGALRGFTNTLCSKAKQMYQIVKLLGSTSVLYPFTERGSYGYHDLTCTREILLHFPDRKKTLKKGLIIIKRTILPPLYFLYIEIRYIKIDCTQWIQMQMLQMHVLFIHVLPNMFNFHTVKASKAIAHFYSGSISRRCARLDMLC